MANHQRDSLEDQAFGPREKATPGHLMDNGAAFMMPAVVTLLLVVFVAYSLYKSLEYQELFVACPKYRNALVTANAAVIIAAAVVVGRTSYEEGRRRRAADE